MGLVVAAVDLGSLANIGWWRVDADGLDAGGRDLNALAELLVADLSVGASVALGFEAPLFLPRPSSTSGLNRQRLGDRGRPWVEFQTRLLRGVMTSDADDVDVLNLAAAALLTVGLSQDVALLTQTCVVVRAPEYQPDLV